MQNFPRLGAKQPGITYLCEICARSLAPEILAISFSCLPRDEIY